MSNAITRVTLAAEGGDPLETVRRAVELADGMIALGATVTVTGDLSMTIHFPPAEVEEEPKPDE